MMEIQPPNKYTWQFDGNFLGLGKNESGLKLSLTEDREFKYWNVKGHGMDFTEGYWENMADTLIPTSKAIIQNDSVIFTLSNADWIYFKEVKFLLKKNKLIGLTDEKLKFKKELQ
ncbi:hypothetical protein [Chondrinema litorale]|uniref:hypothetical protein n=1 Tax=Chondrinema litorale TaxID=2994555 RepID=UPI002542F425|nr:hypothetical protein [Chondrinema litorale]UZR99393.1 hypothetical protein OQ292_36020 [Chondrinema litorale]